MTVDFGDQQSVDRGSDVPAAVRGAGGRPEPICPFDPENSPTDILLECSVYRREPEQLLWDVLRTMINHESTRICRRRLFLVLDRAMAEFEGAGPHLDTFDDLRSSAAFWAETCSPRELEVVFLAALKRLPGEARYQTDAARRRLMVALWQELGTAGRQAFLSRVDPEGRFRGR